MYNHQMSSLGSNTYRIALDRSAKTKYFCEAGIQEKKYAKQFKERQKWDILWLNFILLNVT